MFRMCNNPCSLADTILQCSYFVFWACDKHFAIFHQCRGHGSFIHRPAYVIVVRKRRNRAQARDDCLVYSKVVGDAPYAKLPSLYKFELHAESAIQIGIMKIGFIQSLLNQASSLARVRHNAILDCLCCLFRNPHINAQTTALRLGQNQMPPMCARYVIGDRQPKTDTGPLVLISSGVKAGKGF